MKIKNILLTAALGVSALAFSSCSDYLNVDRYFNDRMTEEKLFEDKKYSEQWLAGVYTHLLGCNDDVCSKGNTPHNFSDDMYFGDRSGLYRNLKYGMYEVLSNVHGKNAISAFGMLPLSFGISM